MPKSITANDNIYINNKQSTSNVDNIRAMTLQIQVNFF